MKIKISNLRAKPNEISSNNLPLVKISLQETKKLLCYNQKKIATIDLKNYCY